MRRIDIPEEPCECGGTEYDISATLIQCCSCGRTWGQCNGFWRLDPATDPSAPIVGAPIIEVLPANVQQNC